MIHVNRKRKGNREAGMRQEAGPRARPRGRRAGPMPRRPDRFHGNPI